MEGFSFNKAIGIAIALFVVILGLTWLVQGNGWFMYKVFAPKYEQVRRETYEQTKSYKQGLIQRLDNLCLQVAKADEGHKSMINDTIRQEFAEWDIADVPAYLQQCLNAARGK